MKTLLKFILCACFFIALSACEKGEEKLVIDPLCTKLFQTALKTAKVLGELTSDSGVTQSGLDKLKAMREELEVVNDEIAKKNIKCPKLSAQ